MKECLNCNGNGHYKCTVCNGKGKIIVEDLSFISCTGRSVRVSKKCYCCDGIGWIVCSECKGTGKIKEEMSEEITNKLVESSVFK